MADRTDREILEACARACGELTQSWYGNDAYFNGVLDRWNPLEDDGDCARMENKCEVSANCRQGTTRAFTDSTIFLESFTPGNNTERRRASCLVVARAQIEREKGGA